MRMRSFHPTFLFALCLFTVLAGCERLIEPEPSEDDTAFVYLTNNIYEPKLVSPKDGGVISRSREVLLRWVWIPTATSFTVQVAFDSLFARKAFVAQTDTSFVRTTSLPGFQYFWRVRAVRDRTESGWSAVRTFYIRLDSPE